jgi:hypothetical protein
METIVTEFAPNDVEADLITAGFSQADIDAMKAIPATQTGTGNMVLSASPTLTGTITGASATYSGWVNVGTAGFKVSGTKVLGAQGGTIGTVTGGSTIDAECRTATNEIIAVLRTHGIIAT